MNHKDGYTAKDKFRELAATAECSASERSECVPQPRPSDIEWLRSWSSRRWGNVFSSDHRELLSKRLRDAARAMAIPVVSLREKVMLDDAAAIAALGDAVSVNYTEFFREPDVLAQLATEVLPHLKGEEVRIWSAAASSGEEAYSLAMLALEVIPNASDRVRILGTDLSPRNVATAELGRYPEALVRPVSDVRRSRFMRQDSDGSFQVLPAVQQLCLFRRLNLQSSPWPFQSRFRLILLRNVLYYFGPETRIALLKRCHSALDTGGYLVTSLTEPLSNAVATPAMWHRVAPAIYRKRGPR